jgi:hypothetical protein
MIWGIINGGNSVKTGAARQESLLCLNQWEWLLIFQNGTTGNHQRQNSFIPLLKGVSVE